MQFYFQLGISEPSARIFAPKKNIFVNFDLGVVFIVHYFIVINFILTFLRRYNKVLLKKIMSYQSTCATIISNNWIMCSSKNWRKIENVIGISAMTLKNCVIHLVVFQIKMENTTCDCLLKVALKFFNNDSLLPSLVIYNYV